MPSSQPAAISQGRNQYAELPPTVAGAMRVEAVVVAPGAAAADRESSNATQPSMVGDERAKVDGRWAVHSPTSQPLEDIGTDLVAITANRGTNVKRQLRPGHAARLELVDRSLDNAARRATPTRMQQRRRARRMREEHGNTIGDRHGHAGSTVEGEVPVSVAGAQPAFP